MALAPLATVEDLEAVGIDTTDTVRVTKLLDAASAAVRDAAGVPISETTATATFPAPSDRTLELPGPVRSVSEVLVDGEQVSDWRLVGSRLWRPCPWTPVRGIPAEVSVTFTFGLSAVPADVVDLVCNLVGAGLVHADGDYAARTGLAYTSIDDFREGYAQGEDATATPLELPPSTRRALRARFGGGVAMVVTRS